MNIIVPHSDRLIQAHRYFTGARDTAILNELVRYSRGQGLLSNLRLYPMLPRTNYGTGATVAGIGGLTANNMTLINGPTWGAGGLAFVAASSQYGSIADFLGSETLTVIHRATAAGTATGALVAQWDEAANKRSWILLESYLKANTVMLGRSSTGTAAAGTFEFYEAPTGGFPTTDTAFVMQWTAGGGRSYWEGKTSRTLTLGAGAAQTARLNSDGAITISSAADTVYASQTALATAFLTGSVTTPQRETLTDMINAL